MCLQTWLEQHLQRDDHQHSSTIIFVEIQAIHTIPSHSKKTRFFGEQNKLWSPMISRNLTWGFSTNKTARWTHPMISRITMSSSRKTPWCHGDLMMKNYHSYIYIYIYISVVYYRDITRNHHLNPIMLIPSIIITSCCFWGQRPEAGVVFFHVCALWKYTCLTLLPTVRWRYRRHVAQLCCWRLATLTGRGGGGGW